jgi:uncharacterized SAM-binding protein YcdF (DUF218 family)
MALLEIILLIVLVIPIFAIFTDSPLGRAVARRLEGRNAPPPELTELVKRIELLESEHEELTRLVETLKEEHQFVQRLLLPPPPAP